MFNSFNYSSSAIIYSCTVKSSKPTIKPAFCHFPIRRQSGRMESQLVPIRRQTQSPYWFLSDTLISTTNESPTYLPQPTIQVNGSRFG
jgi:hypothetical protein